MDKTLLYGLIVAMGIISYRAYDHHKEMAAEIETIKHEVDGADARLSELEDWKTDLVTKLTNKGILP